MRSPKGAARRGAAEFTRSTRGRGGGRCVCDRRGGDGHRSSRRCRGRWRRRRRSRHRYRGRGGLRVGGHRRLCGQEQERVDIAVRILGVPDAEVDVRDVVFDRSARADRPDGRALSDLVAAPHARRAEMREGHRVTIGCQDRHASAAHRHGACERDRSGSRCNHGRVRWSPDVDPPVLAGGVRIVAENELLQDGALNGPRPGACGRHDHESRREHGDQGSTHFASPRCLICQQRPRYIRRRSLSIQPTEMLRRGACAVGR
jgi:hypothetical protein